MNGQAERIRPLHLLGMGANVAETEGSSLAAPLETVDPLLDPRWAELSSTAGTALVFHHPAWLRLIQRQYGCSLGAWALTASDGRLECGLPFALMRSRLAGTRLVALPFSDSCSLLLAPGSRVDPGEFSHRLARESVRRGLDLEVRATFPAGHGAHIVKSFLEHRLALGPDVAAVESKFARGHRRGVAKAIRDGVTVERRTDTDALRRFYRLHLATRRRQGLPTPSKRFILGFSRLFDAGLGFVILARQHERDIAAAVFLTTGATLMYELGASDVQFLRSSPNNMVLMEAIRWGCETGHQTLHFGRTDLDNEGLRRFKRGWGTDESTLHYCRFGSPIQTSSGRSRKVLSRAISGGPPVLGRLVGAAYYRHFG